MSAPYRAHECGKLLAMTMPALELLIPLITGPNLQLKSLRSAAAATSDAVRIVAELSADTRDDATLDDAARTLS